MAREAAVLPGYLTVRQCGDVLHLAPRSVRDLIYAGRLPSVRLSRRHFVRVGDLELERRRRLGLRLPCRKPRSPRAPASAPNLPFVATLADAQTTCASCGRGIWAGAWAIRAAAEVGDLCATCGRRLVLDWAAQRRLEAQAARRMANELRSTGDSEGQARRAA